MKIQFDNRDLDPSEVINKLQSHITSERLTKIMNVIAKRNQNISVLMEDIYDRGNASAVMRSAEAFGFYQIHMVELSEKFKESKRVTQGADKWLITKKWKSTEEAVNSLKMQGFKVAVTHLEGGKPIEECDFNTPTVIAFGNELKGASETLTKLADEKIFIPMQGFVQSFNISVAAAICFYHITLNSKKTPPSPAQSEYLKAKYLLKSIKSPERFLL